MGDLLIRAGFNDISVTDYVGDGSVDIHSTFDCGDISQELFGVEVKRLAGPVGGRAMKVFRSSLADDQRGVFVTTGGFSAGARFVARRRPRIVLIDGERLAALCIRHEIGVRHLTAHLIDTDAFPHSGLAADDAA